MHDFSFTTGMLIGCSIAIPIGPMGLLCIRRTLAWGMPAGISSGLGAATVNLLHGTLVLLGMGAAVPWLSQDSGTLHMFSGLFLLLSAARTLFRRRPSLTGEATPAPALLAAYASAAAFNLVNPMAMVLIVALLSPFAGAHPPSAGEAVLLLLGMFTAAAAWWACLCGAFALLRRRLPADTLLYVNQGAGMLLTVYGTLALAEAAR
ncbi:LysE family translocator [Roseomonas elaeocarpi]|uniref:LysE family translocator n=1 Tax=Roseomonas elaeocarpi TaxID=907779 RepID=A0ABV6JPF1_9PROT